MPLEFALRPLEQAADIFPMAVDDQRGHKSAQRRQQRVMVKHKECGEGHTGRADDGAEGHIAGQQPQQQEQTFREALREQIHEEETSGIKTSYIDLLCGSFFTSQILRRQIWLILLITLFVIIYISNRYSCQKSLLEIDQLRMELQDAKYKALSTSSRLTEKSRQSRVLDMLKTNKDSVLHIADQPPFIVKVPEGE